MSAVPLAKLAILISGRGSNMVAIVRACQSAAIAARPVIVISDRRDAQGLASARELGVATATVLPDGGGAPSFEDRLAARLEDAQADIIALAGFGGRMLNIHPSLLPAYRGLHTHRRVLAAGEREHGASVHFVTPELDSGPVVLQSKVAVEPADTEATLAARVTATEHLIYPEALSWFALRRLAWHDGAAWLDGRPLEAPIVEDFRAATPR
jgi:phosphoribosylglycinamide formyltransferase-1